MKCFNAYYLKVIKSCEIYWSGIVIHYIYDSNVIEDLDVSIFIRKRDNFETCCWLIAKGISVKKTHGSTTEHGLRAEVS